ncbi:DUF2267 domain-containing protein [Haloarcula nitratireducens]|uniref:DUF2267 domain-containing protein n=1 Tax=Haloarcula nitratireducens TaxID=2487749 RepID=A0AAW4PDC2_9EURY|nr:DUF2267 domain-containing protein [Halomicroarcula nitratireducens]MBX0295683.1 DUF2267 domain-containing protein [Halomicroarcula nitratireducens]
MQYDQLLDRLQARTDLPRRNAERLLRVTLRTLAERIGEDEADQLAAELPSELADELRRGKGERFSAEEFVERVGESLGTDPAATQAHARAVFSLLREAVSAGEIEDVRGRLPDSFDRFFEPPEG